MDSSKPQILLTNDDGIESPGLWAAAEGLSDLGYVWVVAPREQCSGMGRSHPTFLNGSGELRELTIHGRDWPVFALNASPAQAVVYALHEIMPCFPALVVSGINYGENVGGGATVSGTIGAALEGAAWGIPSLASSLQTHPSMNLSYSTEIDFSAAKVITTRFARILMERKMPETVKVLKLEIPDEATVDTPWRVARLGMNPYYRLTVPQRKSWDTPNRIRYRISLEGEDLDPRSDIHALAVERVISVTPLHLDLTALVDLDELDKLLRD